MPPCQMNRRVRLQAWLIDPVRGVSDFGDPDHIILAVSFGAFWTGRVEKEYILGGLSHCPCRNAHIVVKIFCTAIRSLKNTREKIA